MKQKKSGLYFSLIALCVVAILWVAKGTLHPHTQRFSKQELWYHSGYPGGVSELGRGVSAVKGPTKMPYIFQAVLRHRLVPNHQLHVDGLKGAKPPAPPIDLHSLRQVHTDRFLNAVLTGKPLRLAVSQGLNRWSPAIARGWLWNVGGFYQAAEVALRKNIITGNLGHGYHHALPQSGMGFCTLNGLVVVAKKLIRLGKAKRVLVLDLDHHEGNGTAVSIVGNASVWNLSIYGDYMGGPPAATNNHVLQVDHHLVPRGEQRDVHYLATIAKVLPTILRQQNPDIILYQAGMDPYGGGGISEKALIIRDAYVFALARSWNKPVTWVLAGGYAPMETLVQLHSNTVRMANQVLLKVRPRDRLVHHLSSPYRWSSAQGKVSFPNWLARVKSLGGLKVQRPRPFGPKQHRLFVQAQRRLFQNHRLQTTLLQNNYRALFRKTSE
ncbi:MAG: hypothetical protein EP343_20120 [Deltaproteobacteria bacterium]|nr:MAG: hypothetical protein EP343_20120 [Deltaproteobacteria bacterium]